MLSGMQNIIVFVWAGFLFFTEKRTALFISKGNKNGKKMLENCFNWFFFVLFISKPEHEQFSWEDYISVY